MTQTIRVVLVDDYPSVRQGLRLLFQTDKTFTVVGEASNGQEALEAAARETPDLVFMDVNMPVMDGVTATQQLKERYPDLKIILFTSLVDRATIVAADEAGADGYVSKGAEPANLIKAVHAVIEGEKVQAL